MWWRRLRKNVVFQNALGIGFATYFRLVRLTNRFVVEPADSEVRLRALAPSVIAMWHGQSFLAHLIVPKGLPNAALISRHGDAAMTAAVIRRLGVDVIWGSGGQPTDMNRKGGAGALREMLRRLAGGGLVGLTADVPKTARVAGLGIITLARLSGRPICPIAIVTSRSLVFDSWDRVSFPLPFGRGAILLGAPIAVDRNADEAAVEAARRRVEDDLNALHVRAYEIVGGKLPWSRDLGPSRKARS